MFIDPKLQDCTHMFMHRDGHKHLLKELYEGPFAVVQWAKHHLYIQLGDKIDAVTIERLKLFNSDSSVLPALPNKRDRPKKTTETPPLPEKMTAPPRKRGRPRKTTEIDPFSLSQRMQLLDQGRLLFVQRT